MHSPSDIKNITVGSSRYSDTNPVPKRLVIYVELCATEPPRPTIVIHIHVAI